MTKEKTVVIAFIVNSDNIIVREAAKKGTCRQGRSVHWAGEENIMHTEFHGDKPTIKEFVMTHGQDYLTPYILSFPFCVGDT